MSQKARNRSATRLGGAPRASTKSPKRVSPRREAPMRAEDHRLPKMDIVSGKRPAVDRSARGSDRRRVVDSGTDRSHDPLGPHSACTSPE